MTRLIDVYCRALAVLVAGSLVIMVLLVFGNVVLRYGFNSGIAISEEISRWLFLWLTFLGAIIAVRERGHMAFDMLVVRLPAQVQRVIFIVSRLLMLLVTWLIFDGSLSQTLINWNVQAPVSGLSMGLFYGVGVVFAVSTGVMLLGDLWRGLRGSLTSEDLQAAADDEVIEAEHEAQGLARDAQPKSQKLN